MNYILEGNAIIPCSDHTKWATWFETADRKIAETYIGNIRVSTVFLSIDHSFDMGVPILFETMVFGGLHDQYQERYATKKDAELGHEQAVEMVTRDNCPTRSPESVEPDYFKMLEDV